MLSFLSKHEAEGTRASIPDNRIISLRFIKSRCNSDVENKDIIHVLPISQQNWNYFVLRALYLILDISICSTTITSLYK